MPVKHLISIKDILNRIILISFFSKVTDIYNPINQRSICDIETLKKRIHDQSVQFSNRYGCKY